jgi:2'-hydroxyisoflavone reductase
LGETYGPLKVACELAAAEFFAGRCLTVRPGYIVGPNDHTDRFTSYLRRAAAGGEMLFPAPPDEPLQVLDARDLASFTLDRLEAADDDVYNVVGPAEPATSEDALAAAREAARADTSFVWVSEELLSGYESELARWFPLWNRDQPGAHTVDAGKAVQAGLQRRTLRETVADILAWDEARGCRELRCGVPAATEQALLAR